MEVGLTLTDSGVRVKSGNDVYVSTFIFQNNKRAMWFFDLLNHKKKQKSSKHVKLFFVGDVSCHISGLVTHINDSFSANNSQNSSNLTTYTPKMLTIDNEEIEFSLWDIVGREDYRMAHFGFGPTKIFIITYSIADINSLTNVTQKWLPKIKSTYSICSNGNEFEDIPVILLGVHAEKRMEPHSPLIEDHLVTLEQGYSVAREIGALRYLECQSPVAGYKSYSLNTSVRNMLEVCCRTALLVEGTHKIGDSPYHLHNSIIQSILKQDYLTLRATQKKKTFCERVENNQITKYKKDRRTITCS